MVIKPEAVGNVILEWWNANKRSYPWRENKTPYEILIAELMLQRTRADQVEVVYSSFLEKFPDIFALTTASEEDLLHFFRKLGLLWRAKKIIKMANYVAKELDGKIPNDKETLLKIPGIGEYISDAVLSFAFEKPVRVVDSNVCRVLNRVYGLRTTCEARRSDKIRSLANQLCANSVKSKFLNFAVIDFAALVCKPRQPLCRHCPLRGNCQYFLTMCNANRP